jgi:hypothetical protein
VINSQLYEKSVLSNNVNEDTPASQQDELPPNPSQEMHDLAMNRHYRKQGKECGPEAHTLALIG